MPRVNGTAIAIVLAWYALASVATLGAFAWDKRRARRAGRRTREKTLHTLELLGGWPGALLAMAIVRHKGSKPGYYLVTWAIALLHALAWAGIWWITWR